MAYGSGDAEMELWQDLRCESEKCLKYENILRSVEALLYEGNGTVAEDFDTLPERLAKRLRRHP